jgi:glutamine synthetase
MDADLWRTLLEPPAQPRPDPGQEHLALRRAEALALARRYDLRLVRFLYCDLAGIIRGKSIHLGALETRLQTGLGLPAGLLALNALDQRQPVAGHGVVGDLRLVPDPATLANLSFAPRTGALLCDLVEPAGGRSALCPRSFLKRMLARGLTLGISFRAGFESEWTLAIRQGEQYVPFDGSLAYSGLGMTNAATVVDEIVAALEAEGLPVDQYHPELGHGQQELTLGHSPALRAADNQLLYRETVRGVAFKQGYYASFAPRAWSSQPGNGCHLHLSLWDPAGETNLLYDRRSEYGLSSTGQQFLAGVLDHLSGLTVLTCPSFNSYRRLVPGILSSAFCCYGPDNREAAVRIPSPFRDQEAASFNLELRASDNTANPYLALGALIAAGLDGVERGLELPGRLLVTDDPIAISPEEREARGLLRLPGDLGDAIAALEADPHLGDCLGRPLAEAFITLRRSEWEAFRQAGESYEHAQHVFKY